MSNYQNIICKQHNSPIGGVCADHSCQKESQLLCMQCISSPNCCIRSKGHEFIPINEFIDGFFDKSLQNWKSSSDTSTNINTIESFLKNSQDILSNFHNENERIGSESVDIYKNFIDNLNNLFIKFNQDYQRFIQEKEEELEKSWYNLRDIFKYDELEGYNKKDFLTKWRQLNYNDLNNSILDIKEGYKNMCGDTFIKDMEVVKEIINMKGDNTIKYFTKEFDDLNKQAVTRFNLYNSRIKVEMFNQDANTNNSNIGNENFSQNLKSEDDISKTKISELKSIYDDTIDYTLNANFQTKHFTIFEHSNGKTWLAYPTSQNTIKLEYWDKFFISCNEKENEELKQKEKKAQDNYFNNNRNNTYTMNQRVNARDRFHYFTLMSHSSRINDIIYYRSKENNDYIISSGDDCAVKIWNITKLDYYLKDVNEYYRCNCVKTLLGHEGRISALMTYYDPLKAMSYIISLGYMDKIKVWNWLTGQLIRDIYDKNVNRGSYDSMMCWVNIQKQNLLFTGNTVNKLVKVWDFDTGAVVKVLQYESNAKIVSMLYYDDWNRLYIIDVNGSCGYVDCKGDIEKMRIVNAKFDVIDKDDRIGCFMWDKKDGIINVFGKNGVVAEYDLKTGKCLDKLKVGNSMISWAFCYVHHTKRKMLAVHTGDYHLKLFN